MDATIQLHPPPSWGVALGRQFVLLVRTQRTWLLGGVMLLLLLIGEVATRGIARDGGPDLPALLTAGTWLWVVGAVWGFQIWNDESPTRRFYHAALPVDRTQHDLARVLAGALCLIAAIAATIAVGFLLAAVGGMAAPLAAIGWTAWLGFFTPPLLLYLLTSAAATALNRPFGVIVLGFGVLMLSLMLAQHFGLAFWQRALDAVIGGGAYAFGTAFTPAFRYLTISAEAMVTARPPAGVPATGQESTLAASMLPASTWLIALTLWFAVLAGANWFAASRRRLG